MFLTLTERQFPSREARCNCRRVKTAVKPPQHMAPMASETREGLRDYFTTAVDNDDVMAECQSADRLVLTFR
jgi:hypothetical protein